MIAASRSTSPAELHPGAFARAVDWCRRQPVECALLAACFGVVVYFFGFYKIFIKGQDSAAVWASQAWNAENNQEHSWFVLPIALGLMWYHRTRLRESRGEPWNAGLALAAFGVGCFVLSVRAVQPRIAIFALPCVLLGMIGFLWGKKTARVALFPCAFLLFMVPIGGFVQGTVSLQILVSTVCNSLASLIDMKIEASGTTIRSLDGSFNFEIAEGCSGIRSLMAMTMLTALYIHFTQREWWKKGVIFAGSLAFALIGNIGRIFTVILCAKFISPRIAGGIYHEYSGFIFFPIAVLSMVAFSHFVNLDWATIIGAAVKANRSRSKQTPPLRKPKPKRAAPSPMTTKRLLILFAVLAAGLSTTLLLPKQLAIQPVGVRMQLPEFSGEWFGQDVKVSDREISILGPETEFARKSYTNGRGDELQVSVVLSGQEMNTSIHRPERCLPAQGWTIADKQEIDVAVPGYGVIPSTCLHNVRNITHDDRLVPIYNLSYYWFVGHNDVTASHLERTYFDIRDRVLHGYNQRWAYITVSAVVTKNLQKFGRSEAETKQLIEGFMRQLVPVLHKDSLKPA